MTLNPSKAPTSCTSTHSSDPNKEFQYTIAMQYALSHIPILQTAVRNILVNIPSFYRQMYTYPSMDIPVNPPELILEKEDPGFDFTVVNFEPDNTVHYYMTRSRQSGATLIRYNIIELRNEIIHVIDDYLTRNQLPGYGISDSDMNGGPIYWHIPLQER